VVGGCRSRDPPGRYDPRCPSLMGPVGGSIPGCCRPGGTCGVDLSTVGVGCTERTGPVEFCGFGDVNGDGGVTGAGGIISDGGRPVTGGVPSTGGTGAVEQCVNQARSDCETCACKARFDDLAPC